jgi:hypothetical protein
MRLDLVVPHLLLPREARDAFALPRLPFLERLFARGERLPAEPAGHARALAARFGLAAAPLPIAALTLAGDDRPQPGPWLRADPVHLAVERDALVLRDASALDLGADDAAALCQALNAHFAVDGLVLVAPHPGRWYLRVPEGELPATTPLDEVAGRNVFGRLPQSSGRINWRRLVTEAQMVLGAHPANARREAEGRLAVNSLWLWGEGATPAALATAHDAVFATEPLARGLAALAGIAPDAYAGIATVLASDAATPLAVDASLTAPWHRGDPEEWRAAALDLDRQVFRAAWEALGEVASIAVHLPGAERSLAARATSAARRRFWRRATPLSRDD